MLPESKPSHPVPILKLRPVLGESFNALVRHRITFLIYIVFWFTNGIGAILLNFSRIDHLGIDEIIAINSDSVNSYEVHLKLDQIFDLLSFKIFIAYLILLILVDGIGSIILTKNLIPENSTAQKTRKISLIPDFLVSTGCNAIVFLAGGAGLILFLIPGIVIYMMFCLSLPIRIQQGTGILRTLATSRTLTKGQRWKISNIILAVTIISALPGVILAVAANLICPPATDYVMSFFMTLSRIWVLSAYAIIYLRLQDRSGDRLCL